MPEIEVEQVFDPFYITKPTSECSSLGLYLSKDIIKLHKGNITVNSEINKFTEFIIKIPKIINM